MVARTHAGFRRCAFIALPVMLGLSPHLVRAIEPLFPTPMYRVAGLGERRQITCDIGAISDVNSDGHLDVVSTIEELTNSERLYDVSILLGAGDGTFGSPRRYPVFYTPLTVSVSDFNRDGAPDLAVGGMALQVSLLLGHGDGSFPTESILPVANGRAISVATGDFNGDGTPDIAAGNSRSSSVDVLLGAGDGTFAPPTSTPTGPHPYSILVDDFNLDSIPDLVSANYGPQSGLPPSIGVALGRGDGSFSAPVIHLTAPGGNIVPSHFPNLLKGGDFNGDGLPDLLARGARGTFVEHPLLLLLGRGDGSIVRGPEVPLRHGSNLVKYHANSFAAGDLDNDGALDIVAAGSDVQLATGKGDGTFESAVSLDVAWDVKSVAIRDVNDDHHADLIVLEGLEDLLVYLGDGDGAPRRHQSPLAAGRVGLRGGTSTTMAVPTLPWSLLLPGFRRGWFRSSTAGRAEPSYPPSSSRSAPWQARSPPEISTAITGTISSCGCRARHGTTIPVNSASS